MYNKNADITETFEKIERCLVLTCDALFISRTIEAIIGSGNIGLKD